MINESEINILRNDIARLQDKMSSYHKLNGEVLENIGDFEEIKRNMIRIQGELRECGTSEVLNKRLIKMDEDISETNQIIKVLEEIKTEIEQKIKILERLIQEKEEQRKMMQI